MSGCRLHDLGDRVADLQREFELGAGKAFRRILETVAAAGLRRHVGDHLGGVGGDLLDAGHVLAEDDAPLQLAGGIVEMHDRAVGAFERLESAGDQFWPALHEHLQVDIVRHIALLDAPAGKVEIGLRCRRKADLDFLEAHIEQQRQHARLALVAHRIDQRLIAVPEIDRAPDRRLFDTLRRPCAVGQVDQRIRLIFDGGLRHAMAGTDSCGLVHFGCLRTSCANLGCARMLDRCWLK